MHSTAYAHQLKNGEWEVRLPIPGHLLSDKHNVRYEARGLVRASEVHDDCRAAHLRENDCVAGHVGLELRYVVTKYPFESRAGFPRIPADFWPQRPFAFELRCLGHAARPGSGGIKDDPLKPGEAMSEKR